MLHNVATIMLHNVASIMLHNAASIMLHNVASIMLHNVASNAVYSHIYVGGSVSFRPDIQRPRQMQNALRDI